MGGLLVRFLISIALVLIFAAPSHAQSGSPLQEAGARIGANMLSYTRAQDDSYRMGAWDSYGQVSVDLENVTGLRGCETGIFDTLRRLLVRDVRSAGVAVRVSTTLNASGVTDAAGAPTAETLGALPAGRTVIYATNLIRVHSDGRRGRNCRSEIDAGRGSSALLDLRGQARPVFIDFFIWSSNEVTPGFIPTTAIGLYSTKALAPLTRDEVQSMAASFFSNFNQSNATVVSTQLAFRETPDATQASLIFDQAATSGAGRINIRLRTTRSVFGDFGNNAPDYRMASAADIMNTPLGNTSIRRTLADAPGYGEFLRVRAGDTDLSTFNAGCTLIQNRVSEMGLTGADQYVALWAAISQHPGYQTDSAFFGSTQCIGHVRSELDRRLGDTQPQPVLTPPRSNAHPDSNLMNTFMTTEFVPYARLDPSERSPANWSKVFSEGAVVRVSPRLAVPISDGRGLTGRFGRIGCYAFTTWRAELADALPGSRVEGVVELDGGGEAYFRAIFSSLSTNNLLRLSELRFDSTIPSLARDRIVDQHGDGCGGGVWRPALVYGPN